MKYAEILPTKHRNKGERNPQERLVRCTQDKGENIRSEDNIERCKMKDRNNMRDR